LLTSLLLWAVLLPAHAAAFDWTVETVGPITSSSGHPVALAVDSIGTPHIAYHVHQPYDLMYAVRTGGTWDVSTAYATGDTGYFPSMQIDGNDLPQISFQSRGGAWDLMFARHEGASWNVETVDATNRTGISTSMALDAANRPHVAYHDWTDGRLKYAYYDGTWHVEDLAAIGQSPFNYVPRALSLVLDDTDRPHVVYRTSPTAGSGSTEYAFRDASGWQTETVAEVSNEGNYFSLELDAANRPRFSFYDDLTDFDLKYAYKDTTWHVDTVDTAGSVGLYSSLALDADGRPYISYMDATNGALKLASFEGTWHTEIVDDLAFGNVGRYGSLAIDNNGNAHIGYIDDANTAIRYATAAVPEPSVLVLAALSLAAVGGWCVWRRR